MKVILVLMLLLGAGWGVMYYKGGIASFDPDEQCKQVKAALRVGMPFPKVMDIAGEPPRYRIINRKVRKEFGEEIEYFVPSPEIKFKRARVEERLLNNELPYGFNATYLFSARSAITISFDNLGSLTGVEKAATVSDLFQMDED